LASSQIKGSKLTPGMHSDGGGKIIIVHCHIVHASSEANSTVSPVGAASTRVPCVLPPLLFTQRFQHRLAPSMGASQRMGSYHLGEVGTTGNSNTQESL
jgi:hypothetical protein